jgi:hypothetical protein
MKKLFLASALILTSLPATAMEDHDAFNQQVAACEASVTAPKSTLRRAEQVNACVENGPEAVNYSSIDRNYLAYRASLFPEVRSGRMTYAQFFKAQYEFHLQQNQSEASAEYQAQSLANQRDTINAIESVPLQQAWWAATTRSIYSSGRGYTPHALRPLR